MRIHPWAVCVVGLGWWFAGLTSTRGEPTPNPLRAHIGSELLEWQDIMTGGDFEDTSLLVRVAPHPLYPFAPTATISRVAEAARTGSYGYQMDAGPGESGWFCARAPVNKARDNIYSTWLRSPGGPRSVTLSISFEDSSNSVEATELSPPFLLVDTNWTLCCFTNAHKQNFHFAWFGLVVTQNTRLYIDDMSVQAPVWKLATLTGATAVVGGIEVPTAPVAPFLFSLLIHIEDPIELYTDPIFFWRKSAVFEELARRVHEAGGFLTIQPEMEWVAAAASNAPGMIPGLVSNYGMRFSVHTHGPNCVDSNGYAWSSTACSLHPEHTNEVTDADAVAYCGERAEVYGALAGTNVTDNNGNWDLTDMSVLAQAGFKTLSGFKNHFTQCTFDEFFTNPWRPSAVAPLSNPTGYEGYDPFGKVIYISGIGASVTKFPHQVKREVQGYLSQAISHAETGRVNTLYIITHADHFFSTNELPADEYIGYDPVTSNYTYSADFVSDLAAWSNVLHEVIKPLADAGYLEWTDLPAMGEEFLAWEKSHAGGDALALADTEGACWLNQALSNASAACPFWNRLHVLGAGDDLDPDGGRPDSLAPTAGDRAADLRDWLQWGNDYLDGLFHFGDADASNVVVFLIPGMSNNLITADGAAPGDPFATERTLENLKAVFRHPDGPGHAFTNAGNTYYALDDLFAGHPDRLFAIITAPPAYYAPADATTDAEAGRARTLSSWLAQDWLAYYNAEHPGLNNVAVFDWFAQLATMADDPDHPNRLRPEYGGEAGSPIPNGLACSNTAAAFVGGYSNAMDAVWRSFLARSTNVLASFDLLNIGRTTGVNCLSWESASGVTYGVDFHSSLESPLPWRRLFHITGSTGAQVVADAIMNNMSNGFYRMAALTGRVEGGQTLITFVDVTGLGDVAVEVLTPTNARYSGNAATPVVFTTGFLFSYDNFRVDVNFTELGLLHVSYLWPGATDLSGVSSAGVFDHAGPEGIRAFAEVLKFVTGQRPNRDGHYLHELIQVTPLYQHTGLYAGSHPGIAAANVLAFYGNELTNIAFFVGWENPTMDAVITMDVGGSKVPLTPVNPAYAYPADYSPTNIILPYDLIRWEDGVEEPFPYFDLNSNGVPDTASDYIFNPPAHQMFSTQFYSRAVLHALEDNGELTRPSWPSYLALPEQADEEWGWRNATAHYPALVTNAPQLKVILVFGKNDHAQIAADKPHIHHAWQGFRLPGTRWVRLNPDRVYSIAMNAAFGATAPDNDANTAPTYAGWASVTNWAYDSEFPRATTYAVKAAVAEMADRCRFTNWSVNLPAPLVP